MWELRRGSNRPTPATPKRAMRYMARMVIQYALEDLQIDPGADHLAVRQAHEAADFIASDSARWWCEIAELPYAHLVSEARNIAVITKLRILDKERRVLQ